MPQDAVEDLILTGYEYFNRSADRPVEERDLASPDFWHPDAVYVNSSDDPDPGVHRGLEAIGEQVGRWVETYPDLRVEPLEIRTNGNVAFVWVRFSGHGAESGVPIEMELAHIVTVDGGKFRRIEEYLDRAEGLRVAGLGGSEDPST
jgi:ketosteroid isomerase-like protein